MSAGLKGRKAYASLDLDRQSHVQHIGQDVFDQVPIDLRSK